MAVGVRLRYPARVAPHGPTGTKLRRSFLPKIKSQRIVLYMGAAALVAALLQLVLGASPVVVLLDAYIITLGFLGFVMLGASNGGAWVVLFYALGSVLIGLYAKTLMGQTLQSNLFAPLGTFLVLSLATGALFAAAILAKAVPVGRELLRPTSNPRVLSRLSWGSFLLGVLFWFINQHSQSPGGSGFGGVSILRELLLMAVIARTAMIMVKTDSKKTLDVQLVMIIGVCTVLGVLTDTKMQAAYPVVSYFATVIFFKGKLPRRHVALFSVGALAFMFVVAPFIHAWRYLGAEKMTMRERITLIERSAEKVFQPGGLEMYLQLSQMAFQHQQYNYFGNGKGQMILGRYVSLQQIDPVVHAVDRKGELGGQAVWSAFARIVPSFLYPGKPQYSQGYWNLLKLGLVMPESGKFPVLPMAGQLYAAYGFAGVFILSFLTFTGFLLALKKLGWNLQGNVFAIFFFCSFVIVTTAQGSFDQYVSTILRDFPLVTVFFLMLGKESRVRRRFCGVRNSIRYGSFAPNRFGVATRSGQFPKGEI